MSIRRLRRSVSVVAAGALLVSAPAIAGSPADLGEGLRDTLQPSTGAPLFASHEVLHLTLEAPLDEIFKERGQESSDHAGVLTYRDADAGHVALDVGVRTRGKTRLDRKVCRFPPLRINFKKKQVENTIFTGQDKVKLVTHCQSGRDKFEQFLMLEYLIYRSYNILTDLSFRVRLAQITYVDTEEPEDSVTRFAFFIEHRKAVAQRSGWQSLTVPMVPPQFIEHAQLSLLEIFQFMIGNTDWDALLREPDRENCCHNVRPVGSHEGPVFPIPYDFDWTGVVDPPYAEPHPDLRLRSVRQRLYRGLCRSHEAVSNSFAVFNQRRDAIYALYLDEPALDDEYRRRTIEYLDEFYEIINDAGKVRSQIFSRCRS
jgi:hypothetical protein